MATDGADHVGIADDHELVCGAGHPNVELLPSAIDIGRRVDAEDDRTALESLAPEDVPVEDVARVPERLPVAGLTETRLISTWRPSAPSSWRKLEHLRYS